MPSGDARIDFEEEVSPGKGTVQSLIKTVVPFLVLVLAKTVFQQFTYGLVLIGLNLVAVRLNAFVVRQVQLKRQVSHVKLVYTLLLCGVIYYLVVVFFSRVHGPNADPYLAKLMTGRPRERGHLSWLVWLVICADTAMKLTAIAVKCFVLLLTSKFICLFKRGCLLSLVEVCSRVQRQLAGFQLIPFILAVNDSDNPTIAETYMGYLLLFTFIGFKLFLLFGIFTEFKSVVQLLLQTPSFNFLIDQENACDLTMKVDVTCRDEDLLHWMATYGTHPETGHTIVRLPGGDGRTALGLALF